MKVSRSGGNPLTIAGAQADPRDIEVDGTSVYWVNRRNSADTGTVMKATPK